MKNNYKIKTENRNGNRIAIITPEIAEKIFSERLPNRPFNMGRAKLYAKAMLEGKWKSCSQLSFCNGKLDDGQHRMMASVLSGKSFEGTIYHHSDSDTFTVFDIGKKRSNADVLAIEGNKNVNALAASLQLLEKVNSKNGLPNAVGGASITTIPTYEIMNVLAKYPGIQESTKKVCSHIKHFRIPSASTIVLHYYLTKTEEEILPMESLADKFIVDKLLKGLELKEDDPVYTFRKYLMKIKNAVDISGSSRISHNLMLFGGIVTWNKWVSGKKSKMFKAPETNFMPKIERLSSDRWLR